MKRNKFSLSHYKLASMDMGVLVPISWFEVLPGDTIQQTTAALIRAAPLVAPVMHPIDVRIHHWFVPYRLVWSSWENFITGGPDGLNTSVFPTMVTAGTVATGSLFDYLGVPGSLPVGRSVSALPFRAYNMIYNEWYRDQDLNTPVANVITDGVDATSNRVLLNCSWEKDYFTSSRPWPQKGPAITIPIGTTAPVKGIGLTGSPTQTTGPTTFRESNPLPDRSYAQYTTTTAAGLAVESTGAAASAKPLVYADLSNASAVTVTALRAALAIQRFEEARARYGSRYVEYLRYLGVRSSDARLQKPEYLGGGKQRIQFSEVLQTAPSASPDQANTVGALKGHGLAALRSNRYRRFFEEHGLVMTLMSIRPKTMYMDGLERKWNRRLKEDFWQKEIEHTGQQTVQQQEIYAATGLPTDAWGYQDRYDEYRRAESTVSGEMRNTLNYWHLGRIFGSYPALNASFVDCVPTLRTFASATTDPFYIMANHSIQARRLVAKTGKSYIF